ncbi:hypothetical protein BZA05DRAFT_434535, partial [Tricharina praecox]|uniref:uncharacterized protein n=1 Tax=Tricharina praecox TaxID=43433 RepID=UPI00221FC7F5
MQCNPLLLFSLLYSSLQYETFESSVHFGVHFGEAFGMHIVTVTPTLRRTPGVIYSNLQLKVHLLGIITGQPPSLRHHIRHGAAVAGMAVAGMSPRVSTQPENSPVSLTYAMGFDTLDGDERALRQVGVESDTDRLQQRVLAAPGSSRQTPVLHTAMLHRASTQPRFWKH